MKFFNLKTHRVERIKKDAIVIRKAFHSEILSLPIMEMIKGLKECLKDTHGYDINGKVIYYDIKITGRCDKNDVEDLYDYIENVLTDIYCENYEENKKAEEQDRLGLFGLPEINMKTMNYLRWVKFNTRIEGIGFEVGKINSCWKKRMVK